MTIRKFRAYVRGGRASSRDNAVRLPDGGLYHIDGELMMLADGRRVGLCDSGKGPYTLRAFAPKRDGPAGPMKIGRDLLSLTGVILIAGVWVCYVAVVNVRTWDVLIKF